jgi:hypothetical protein
MPNVEKIREELRAAFPDITKEEFTSANQSGNPREALEKLVESKHGASGKAQVEEIFSKNA